MKSFKSPLVLQCISGELLTSHVGPPPLLDPPPHQPNLGCHPRKRVCNHPGQGFNEQKVSSILQCISGELLTNHVGSPPPTGGANDAIG